MNRGVVLVGMGVTIEPAELPVITTALRLSGIEVESLDLWNPDSTTAGVIQLPPGLKDSHSHRVGKVQAAIEWPHRQGDSLCCWR